MRRQTAELHGFLQLERYVQVVVAGGRAEGRERRNKGIGWRRRRLEKEVKGR